ncbi:MAG: hypothetical protein A2Y17_04140 [Clostridiales bacterium GWF2_38_85]|nr:MAG: hypothetical protein A2Y17_04140 [Clostridiales bacterium GWF2_38_85]
MIKKKYWIFYFSSLLLLLAASAYPIYMGIKTLNAYIENGAIEVANYPKYIIPYTPMCIGILVVAVLFPLLYKLFKKYSMVAGSVLGVAAFWLSEIGLEQIKVITGYTYETTIEKIAVPLES